jgi:hypothetical protein
MDSSHDLCHIPELADQMIRQSNYRREMIERVTIFELQKVMTVKLLMKIQK